MTTGYRNRIGHQLLPFALCVAFLFSSIGCSYDGWLMQMDSNSPSPFFGLGFSVDSGSRPGQPTQNPATRSDLKKATIDNKLALASVVGIRPRRSTDSPQLTIPEGAESRTEDVDLRLSSF